MQLFWRLFIRKETPANVPSSQALLFVLLVLTFVMGLVHLLFVQSRMLPGIAAICLDLAVLFLFTHFLLRTYRYEARFRQTVIALIGVNLVAILIMLPAKIYLAQKAPFYIEQVNQGNKAPPDIWLVLSSLFMLIIFIKTFMAIANILVNAIEIKQSKAFMICFLYFMINLVVSNSLVSLLAKNASL